MPHAHPQRRIFSLSYTPEHMPTFQTQEEIDEFHRAIGRMVTYGLTRSSRETHLELVTAQLTHAPLELCAVYHPPVLAQPHQYADGTPRYLDSPAQSTDTLIQTLGAQSAKAGRPFVMAAVRHMDGQWGFHS